MNVEEAKTKLRILEETCQTLTEEINQIRTQIGLFECPVFVGDIVTNGQARGRVVAIHPGEFSSHSYRVGIRRLRKDGSESAVRFPDWRGTLVRERDGLEVYPKEKQ